MRALIGQLLQWCFRIMLGAIVLSILLVILFRFVPLPGSMVMLERKVSAVMEREPMTIQYQWTPWRSLSDQAKLAVIAAEDQKFPYHYGFDLDQVHAAIGAWKEGKSLRGASTISQQTAKNVFLWSDRSWLRKGLEVWFTLLVEVIWPKERILEVYLNIVEWDEGVFGLEAAAQHYYGIGASQVTADQAARLAAILPNPRGWSASAPSARVLQRSAWVRQQMRQMGGTRFLQRLQ